MHHAHPRRPQAALVHAAQVAFQHASHDVDRVLEAFSEALARYHHARLPRGWDAGLGRALFQGAMDRHPGDLQQAARQVARDLGMMNLFSLTRPLPAHAA